MKKSVELCHHKGLKTDEIDHLNFKIHHTLFNRSKHTWCTHLVIESEPTRCYLDHTSASL